MARGQSSPLLAVAVDEKLIPSDEFEVTGVKSGAQGNSATLTIRMHSTIVAAELSARVDESWQMRWSLKVTNTDSQPHRLRVFFPLLSHLLIGDAKHNYYFYPFKGGWTSNEPFHLGHGYGTPTGSLQVASCL